MTDYPSTGHDDVVTVETASGSAWITLNRPEKKNAIGTDMWRALESALDMVRDDRTVRVVVLTGAGETFCAGADIAAPAQPGQVQTHRSQHERMQWFNSIVATLVSLPQPTIAAVDGAAMGIGMNLAISCDFVIATDRARFGEVFIKRALNVDGGGSWLLPRLVGLRQAKRLCMLGDPISATEALDIGLITSVVAPADLEAAVTELATTLTGYSAIALAGTKALLEDSFDCSYEQALEAEARLQALNIGGPDFQAAVKAFTSRSK